MNLLLFEVLKLRLDVLVKVLLKLWESEGLVEIPKGGCTAPCYAGRPGGRQQDLPWHFELYSYETAECGG